ncbi:hypothetical protein QTG56_24845 (plasmid) [Rossellomorea sp. AcN35-11]|nr:hypothetical protein [Rossellomorea aquimaris]WJV31864.1 hypothetical protein QTG56_24845 [Rossellomorea sp. AcN35-11]
MDELFGEVIFSYTREDMINDGELVDVSEMAKEAGFKIPVGIKKAVYEELVVPSEKDKGYGQDVEGRLWDTLTMLKYGIRTNPQKHTFQFPITYVIQGEAQTKILKGALDSDSQGQPAITVMLPSED